ncbi:unnamed protein product [Clonostachys rosea]|uniref:Uncharacterized protein n=1 Tax=Bionectria ochroleuca TaxID=29856 RepID=A0ABY6U765_BIOOC|nr:unnamed protein product [Clonostachys rosea]
MWRLRQIDCSFTLWFSDGEPLTAVRSQTGVSYRLIVDQLGFLDLLEVPHLPQPHAIIANDEILMVPDISARHSGCDLDDVVIKLDLQIHENGIFTLTYHALAADIKKGAVISAIKIHHTQSVSGALKPLPNVCADDVTFMNTMIERKYVPYPHVPDSPGKSMDEIEALGRRLFPFTPYSFQLALCVYDWTTASFTRMVFFKIFEYTGIPQSPFPIDQDTIAAQIWASNWDSYNPKNPDYMHSFMMEPADSLDSVKAQLQSVADDLHKLSDVENRLLSAAMQALPRTSTFQHTQLFSGQVDIFQLGVSHFGVEFLECPLNDGPVGKELITTLDDARASYLSAGRTITTKMVWSFADNLEDAIHYSNGILLVANIPEDSFVWEHAAYVTPLSDDPKKTEYTFPPGTPFEVQSVYDATVQEKEIVVILLGPPGRTCTRVNKMLPGVLDGELKKSDTSVKGLPHTPSITGGRRCACQGGI